MTQKCHQQQKKPSVGLHQNGKLLRPKGDATQNVQTACRVGHRAGSHVSDEEFTSRVCKGRQLQDQKTPRLTVIEGLEQHFCKADVRTDGRRAHANMLTVTGREGNARQNHDELPPLTHRNSCDTNMESQCGPGTERGRPVYTAGGTVTAGTWLGSSVGA